MFICNKKESHFGIFAHFVYSMEGRKDYVMWVGHMRTPTLTLTYQRRLWTYPINGKYFQHFCQSFKIRVANSVSWTTNSNFLKLVFRQSSLPCVWCLNLDWIGSQKNCSAWKNEQSKSDLEYFKIRDNTLMIEYFYTDCDITNYFT